jgi:CHASE3 domain sensor protein
MVRSTSSGMAAHPLPFRTRNWLLIGMIFVVVMLLALITLPPLVSARDDAIRAQLDDAQAFADALILTENDVQQMQSNTRGYLITQAPTFLEQYRATQDKLPTDLERLRELGPRLDGALEAQVAELIAVVERWQRERADRQIALVEQGRVADAAAEVAADDSQALFESFRSRVGDLQQQTQTTQAELREQLNRARALQFSITTGLGVLGLLALGFVIVGFRRLLALMQTIEIEHERTEALAEQVRAQLHEAEQRNQQLTVLNAVAVASAQSIQREQRAHNVLTAIAHALALPAGAIWVAHNADRQLELVARHAARNGRGAPPMHPMTTSFTTAHASAQLVDVPRPIIQALRDGNPILVSNGDTAGMPADQVALMSRLGEQIRSGIVLPLRGRGQPIGVLVLASDQPQRFTADELPFFTTLAAEVGVVLENAQLFTEVQTERQRL